MSKENGHHIFSHFFRKRSNFGKVEKVDFSKSQKSKWKTIKSNKSYRRWNNRKMVSINEQILFSSSSSTSSNVTRIIFYIYSQIFITVRSRIVIWRWTWIKLLLFNYDGLFRGTLSVSDWLSTLKRFYWLKIILVKNRIYFAWLVENSSRDCQHIQRPIRSVSVQDNHSRLDHMSVRSNGISNLPDNYDPIRIRAACNLQIRKWIRWNKS